jgi:hypothetical protein
MYLKTRFLSGEYKTITLIKILPREHEKTIKGTYFKGGLR